MSCGQESPSHLISDEFPDLPGYLVGELFIAFVIEVNFIQPVTVVSCRTEEFLGVAQSYVRVIIGFPMQLLPEPFLSSAIFLYPSSIRASVCKSRASSQ